MLTKLMPDQISAFWDIIKYAIEESLPPIVGESPDKMNKILAALLIGKGQCWASHNRTDGISKFEGIVVTEILYDGVSDTRSLLIYCLYGYEDVEKEDWLKGLKILIKYAISQGCNHIIGYSDIPLLLRMANRLGGETKYTFVRIPLFNDKTED